MKRSAQVASEPIKTTCACSKKLMKTTHQSHMDEEPILPLMILAVKLTICAWHLLVIKSSKSTEKQATIQTSNFSTAVVQMSIKVIKMLQWVRKRHRLNFHELCLDSSNSWICHQEWWWMVQGRNWTISMRDFWNIISNRWSLIMLEWRASQLLSHLRIRWAKWWRGISSNSVRIMCLGELGTEKMAKWWGSISPLAVVVTLSL